MLTQPGCSILTFTCDACDAVTASSDFKFHTFDPASQCNVLRLPRPYRSLQIASMWSPWPMQFPDCNTCKFAITM